MASVRPFVLDRKLFNVDLYKRIQALWFAGVPQGATIAPQETEKRWFGVGVSEADKESFDSTCRSSFLDAIESVGPEKYHLPPGSSSASASAIAAPFLSEITARESSQDDGEASAASNALSLIILFDQLSRNIFRTPSGLFHVYTHYDRLSISLLYHILRTTPRLDLHPLYRLYPVYRLWFYLPLMHSEAPSDHTQFASLLVDLRAELVEAGDEMAVAYVDKSIHFQKRHSDIIDRFGKYPHRDEALQRKTTEDERKWLEEGGETFGVKSSKA